QVRLFDHPVDPWAAAQQVFADYKRSGVQTVLLIRLGAYVEFDLPELMRFHLEQQHARTFLSDEKGPVDYWLLDASRCGAIDVGVLGTPQFADYNSAACFRQLAYANRLEDAYDIRSFVVDAFLSRSSVKPEGAQVRPGVWIHDAAQIHRRARI